MNIKLRRGFDIRLQGQPERLVLDLPGPTLAALKPTDLHGLAPIPKLETREGDEVQAGSPVFFDKSLPDVHFCAPVSGEVIEVRRGAKRKIEEIVILSDSKMTYREHAPLDPAAAARSDIVERLCQGGAWVLIRRRPYNVVPDPAVVPRDIFVSCFDTAPLAPSADFLIEGQEADFLDGLTALKRLTSGEVHLGVNRDSSDLFRKAPGARIHEFAGPHPAGNVGVQIHHVRPISKGEVVWTVKPQDVAVIGRLVRNGIYDARRRVAITGPELRQTGYVDTPIGGSIQPMVDGNLKDSNVRTLSGNVLTGTRVAHDGFLGLFDDQLTVIEEGDRQEFMGWLIPSYRRPSLSRTFLSSLIPGGAPFRVNTNEHGERRAFVMTGEYERVLPMDIHAQHLIKSILYRDYDQMEGLGIYEVVEEDLALCEFVCTSKQPVQRILREGLDLLRNEG
jgi:Na+-transporting NADH:ubiquinone oxidoreductase subunit A